MLDPKFIRDNSEAVKVKIARKNKDPELVDKWIMIDKKLSDTQKKLEELNRKKNENAEKLKDATQRSEELISIGKKLKEEAAELETVVNSLKADWNETIILIPNIAFDDVPVGKDESENVVIRKVGKPTEFNFEPKDHIELGEALGIIDTKKASIITGSRFNYLMGDAAVLEYAIVSWVFATLRNQKTIQQVASKAGIEISTKPFIPVVPPVMIKPDVYTRMGRLDPIQAEERYYIASDDIYLIGSAEHTLGPLFIDQIIDETELPIRYIGFSTAFRREAGSYGKDVKGILRVHQFDKLEIESFTTPEESRKEQDLIVALQEHLLQELKLPYQVVSICTGDMGGPDARQLDIETWIPAQNKYRETHTSDLMTDYQARRLNTRIRRKDGAIEFAHMNDATAFAIGRILIAILENYQQQDGSIKVPEILVPFVGFDEISAKK